MQTATARAMTGGMLGGSSDEVVSEKRAVNERRLKHQSLHDGVAKEMMRAIACCCKEDREIGRSWDQR